MEGPAEVLPTDFVRTADEGKLSATHDVRTVLFNDLLLIQTVVTPCNSCVRDFR